MEWPLSDEEDADEEDAKECSMPYQAVEETVRDHMIKSDSTEGFSSFRAHMPSSLRDPAY